MVNSLSMKIFDGVLVEDENEPHCLVVVEQPKQPILRVPIPSRLLLHPIKCLELLIGAGLNATYDSAYLRNAFAEAVNAKRPSPIKIATKPGWHGDDFYLFGTILSPPKSKSKWLPDTRTLPPALAHAIKADQKLKALLIRLMPLSARLQFVVLATFAAPIFALLDEPEMPIFHIWGKTKRGKTTLFRVMNGLQRDIGDRSLKPFDFSKTGIEDDLVNANHSILCLDETGNLSRNELAQVIETYLYYIAGGESRARPKAFFKNRTWRSLVAFSGEFSLTELSTRRVGSGQDARLMTIHVPPDGIWEKLPEEGSAKALKKLAKASKTYSAEAYEKWIRFLVAKGASKLRAKFRKRVAVYAKKLMKGKEDDGVVQTLARKFAVIAVTGRYLEKAGVFPPGVLNPERVVSALYLADRAAKTEVLASNLDDGARLSALQLLSAAMAKGVQRLEPNSRNTLPADCEAFMATQKGREYLYVFKDRVDSFVSVSATELFENLKTVSGLLHGSRGDNTYGQFMQEGKRRSVLQLDFATLVKTARP
ncbi:DUF927 domain-containing protein [Rhizobium hidalgonense]|uniref:DUF927 domain-containing protein n=1 Tax=Rhizobium hidalgonense TaxID=1538159 RepID=UPI000FEC3AC5|nr:DUF927 domain-containing protein [Rhizobium hidalgonense]RWX13461.1 DUF927 domain-containing protein [Rhizobium hidalgonense]